MAFSLFVLACGGLPCLPAGGAGRRRNEDCQPMNENVISVKTGIEKGLSLKIVLRIAQFKLYLLRS
jgi:hypothetical protein